MGWLGAGLGALGVALLYRGRPLLGALSFGAGVWLLISGALGAVSAVTS